MAMEETKLVAQDMGRTCDFCKGRTFRRSRLKLKDVGSLLALHYPVRCLSCSKRQSVGLDVARKAVPSTVRQVRATKDEAPRNLRPSGVSGIRVPVERPGIIPLVNAEAEGAAPARPPMTMPDLQGVTLPRVAQMPPGDGENLA